MSHLYTSFTSSNSSSSSSSSSKWTEFINTSIIDSQDKIILYQFGALALVLSCYISLLHGRMQRNNGTSGSHAACASCKHQRKKCDNKCVLYPYFPAEKSAEFQAVHKVFGVSNVTKMLQAVDENDRPQVAQTLVWEARQRQKDPVNGVYGEFQKAQNELLRHKNWIQNQAMQLRNLQAQLNNKKQDPSTGSWKDCSNNASLAYNRGTSNTAVSFAGRGVDCAAMNIYARDSTGSCIVDPIQYHYQGQEEGKINSSAVPLQQPHHAFNQTYYNPPGITNRTQTTDDEEGINFSSPCSLPF